MLMVRSCASAMMILFFFSSRRRHTRFDCDWSSDVCSSDLFRRTPAGRQLMACIYQPQGTGPFPTVLDLHGGAWRRKDRLAEEPMDRAIAASRVLVVAIDLRLSEEAPDPASVPRSEERPVGE